MPRGPMKSYVTSREERKKEESLPRELDRMIWKDSVKASWLKDSLPIKCGGQRGWGVGIQKVSVLPLTFERV